MELVRARLGHDLHDAAGGLAVLRFEAAGLHLDFLHERQVDAGGERAVDARVHADAAEAAVGDAHAIRYVVVFQTGSARDRRIRRSRAAAGSYARRRIEQTGDATSYRNRLVEGVGQVGVGDAVEVVSTCTEDALTSIVVADAPSSSFTLTVEVRPVTTSAVFTSADLNPSLLTFTE